MSTTKRGRRTMLGALLLSSGVVTILVLWAARAFWVPVLVFDAMMIFVAAESYCRG